MSMRMRLDLTLKHAAPDDARLDAPAFHRNGLAMVEALSPRLAEGSGEVLEIGSGTGQHVALFAHAFPHLVWRPSDPNPAHRASIDAWRAASRAEKIRPAIDLDAAAPEWPPEAETPASGFRAALCANVIHISPWSVAEGLFRGVAGRLAQDGFLALYGPFRWRGRHISDSNAAFDAQLRARDRAWGVRDVDEIDQLANDSGLTRIDVAVMPANNHMLFFARAG